MKKLRLSIKAKVIILVFIFGLVLVEVAMIYYSIVISKSNEQTYKNVATNLSTTVSQVVDVEQYNRLKTKVKNIVDSSTTFPIYGESTDEEYNAYMAQFEDLLNDNDYKELHAYLKRLETANSNDIDCIYMGYVDASKELFVYVVDSDESEDFCPPGCLDHIYEENHDVILHPEKGFPAYVSNTQEYGWLATAGEPVYLNGNVEGYVFVDVALATARSKQASSIVRLFCYLAGTVILISVASVVAADFLMIRPLKRMTATAKAYDSNDPKKTHETFVNLTVKNRDELGDLAKSMKKMESDVHGKIQELTLKNEELASSQKAVKKMTELASKDGLTGVRNKIAYNNEVERINKAILEGKQAPFGIAMVDMNYLKHTNDAYGHNCGDNALVKLCSIICVTFAHSPVFRIGGDEFVAILKGTDYKRSEQLVQFFKEKIDELINDQELTPSERVSAAIGYAEFDSKHDESVSDVFSRADKAMYDQKRAMKGESQE